MGKSVQIVAIGHPRPGFVRFEIDRSFTGTSHESFDEPPDSQHQRLVDQLARAVFSTGLIKRLHVFSNIITVESAISATKTGESEMYELRNAIEQLLIHYRPGVMPTPV